MEKKLKRSIINLYGVPSFGFQMLMNIDVFYFVAFLTDYAKIPIAMTGTVLMVTSIFDTIGVPIAGIILEKSNMRWGKYRSWLLVGPPVMVIFFVLQFSKIGSPTMNAILISIGFIVSHVITSIFYAGHIAMNSSMTQEREERIAMASNRGMFNAIGAICFSLVGMPMILAIGKLVGNPSLGYTYTAIIMGIFMIACYYTLFFMTKDYAHHGTSTQSGKPEEKMSIGEMLKQIIVNAPLIGLLFGEFGRYLGRFVIFGLAFYYFKYVVNNLAVITIFFTGLNVVCFFGAAITNPLAKKIGERNTYIISLSIFILGLLIVWAFPMNYVSFMCVMFVSYLGYGMPDALGVAMYSSTVEYGEWKTGRNARGFIMSLISFPIKIALFFKSIIVTAILVGTGYVANMAPTPEFIKGITNGITLIPAIIMVIGLFFIVLLYKITPSKLAKMQAEIAATKAGK